VAVCGRVQANRNLPKIMKTLLRSIILVSAFQFFAVSAFSQGALTPPGPPAPTMKTLTQVEPRTEVATLSGDSSNLYIINQPGSYYLSGNINGVASKKGISIQADNVTLDLSGFAVIGLGGSVTTNGINIPNTQINITIRNGTVRGWQDGIAGSHDLLVEAVHASNNNLDGILVGRGSVVRACTADSNALRGIEADVGSTIANCAAINNTLAGIRGLSGSTITACGAYFNGAVGIQATAATVTGCAVQGSRTTDIGIQVDVGSTVSNCAVSNADIGINGVDGSVTIVNCMVYNNKGDGISAGNNAYILENNATANGSPSGGTAGIHITGNGGRIEGNVCNNNNFDGIWLDNGTNGTVNTMNNFVIKNIARSNPGFNYRIQGLTSSGLTGTNEVAPLQVPMNATNPEANSQ
jgi:hypothetical protein